MLLMAAAAIAAPLVPVGRARPGVEVSATTGLGAARLVEPGCTGDACIALREVVQHGGELRVGLTRALGLYAHGAYTDERIDAARYAEPGYALGAGARASVPVGGTAALDAWAGVEHQHTATINRVEEAVAWHVDAGVVLRGGGEDDGITGWIGAGTVPWSSQRATVLDGALSLRFAPQLPVEAVAGFEVCSDPLFGPVDDRTRIAAGATASVGYRNGFAVFLSFLR